MTAWQRLHSGLPRLDPTVILVNGDTLNENRLDLDLIGASDKPFRLADVERALEEVQTQLENSSVSALATD